MHGISRRVYGVSPLQIDRYRQERFQFPQKAEVHVRGMQRTICVGSREETRFGRTEAFDRPTFPGRIVAGRHCGSGGRFRSLASKIGRRKVPFGRRKDERKKKRQATDDPMRRNVVFRRFREEQIPDLACCGCRDWRDCRPPCRLPRHWGSPRSLEFPSSGVQAVRCRLYGLLGILRFGPSVKKTRIGLQGFRKDECDQKIQLYNETESFPSGQKNAVFFEEIGELHS